MNYIDFFSGIGAFLLGAIRAGFNFKNKFHSEIDPYSNKIYDLRFPGSIQLGDINDIDYERLPDGEYIITGGFPCQDVSVAGLKAGITGERSGLFRPLVNAIRVVRPIIAVLENVADLLKRGMGNVCGELAEIGYDSEWDCIPAGAIGAHFLGDRVFITAYRSPSGGLRWERGWKAQMGKNQWGGDEFERLVRLEVEHGVPAGKIGRISDGIPNRIHRLKCLGNSIVPQIAELLFNQIKHLL